MGNELRNRLRLIGAVASAVVLLDQATKAAAEYYLRLHESLPVIEGFFHLTYVRNTGGAFGFLAGAPAAFRIPFFLVVTAIAVGVLLTLLLRAEQGRVGFLLSLAGVLGGALGNLIDRVRFGAVIDFLDLQFRGYHWPAFNLADSCITLGVVGLLFCVSGAGGEKN